MTPTAMIPYLSTWDFIAREGEKIKRFEKETLKKIKVFVMDALTHEFEPRFADTKLSGPSWHTFASRLWKLLVHAAQTKSQITFDRTIWQPLQTSQIPMLASKTQIIVPYTGASSYRQVDLFKPHLSYNSYAEELPLGELAGVMAHEIGHFKNDDFQTTFLFHPKVKHCKKNCYTKLRYYKIYYAEMRSQQYRADEYAVRMGLGKGFLAYLKRTLKDVNKMEKTLRLRDKYYLFSDHPPLQFRIQRVEKLMQQMWEKSLKTSS